MEIEMENLRSLKEKRSVFTLKKKNDTRVDGGRKR